MIGRQLCAGLLLAMLVALAGCGDGGGGQTTGNSTGDGGKLVLGPSFGSFATLPGVQRKPPPWGPNDGPTLKPRLLAMGLQPLPQEGAVVHIHQHLDLFVGGTRVTVPAGIGISAVQRFFSPLHTHDTTGVLHVESATASEFSLGQVFGVWGVPLNRRCIGSLCAGGGKELRAWVNGEPVDADPTRIVLASHQEIVLAFGTPGQMPKDIPRSYDFPAGE
jgi:hypothetical protein